MKNKELFQERKIKILEEQNQNLANENKELKNKIQYLQQINDMLSDSVAELREECRNDHNRVNGEIAKLESIKLKYSICISEYRELVSEYKRQIHTLLSDISKIK